MYLRTYQNALRQVFTNARCVSKDTRCQLHCLKVEAGACVTDILDRTQLCKSLHVWSVCPGRRGGGGGGGGGGHHKVHERA